MATVLLIYIRSTILAALLFTSMLFCACKPIESEVTQNNDDSDISLDRIESPPVNDDKKVTLKLTHDEVFDKFGESPTPKNLGQSGDPVIEFGFYRSGSLFKSHTKNVGQGGGSEVPEYLLPIAVDKALFLKIPKLDLSDVAMKLAEQALAANKELMPEQASMGNAEEVWRYQLLRQFFENGQYSFLAWDHEGGKLSMYIPEGLKDLAASSKGKVLDAQDVQGWLDKALDQGAQPWKKIIGVKIKGPGHYELWTTGGIYFQDARSGVHEKISFWELGLSDVFLEEPQLSGKTVTGKVSFEITHSGPGQGLAEFLQVVLLARAAVYETLFASATDGAEKLVGSEWFEMAQNLNWKASARPARSRPSVTKTTPLSSDSDPPKVTTDEAPTAADQSFASPSRIALLQRYAESGEGRAAAILSYHYQLGFGVPIDGAKAFSYAKASAEARDSLGVYFLSICYREGVGVSKDVVKANKLERTAGYSLSVEVEETAAKEEKVAIDAWVFFALGRILHRGHTASQDEGKIVLLYTTAADIGLAYAQAELGFRYLSGQSVPKNVIKGTRLLTKAADQGLAIAQNQLGICYANGIGVKKNSAKSIELYAKAADQGFANAQIMLGLSYLQGDGVTKNAANGVELITKAAEQGNEDALYNLARIYLYGDGVDKNTIKAMTYYEQAAQKNVSVNIEIGQVYYNEKIYDRALAAWDKVGPAVWKEHFAKDPSKEVKEKDMIGLVYLGARRDPPWMKGVAETEKSGNPKSPNDDVTDVTRSWEIQKLVGTGGVVNDKQIGEDVVFSASGASSILVYTQEIIKERGKNKTSMSADELRLFRVEHDNVSKFDEINLTDYVSANVDWTSCNDLQIASRADGPPSLLNYVGFSESFVMPGRTFRVGHQRSFALFVYTLSNDGRRITSESDIPIMKIERSVKTGNYGATEDDHTPISHSIALAVDRNNRPCVAYIQSTRNMPTQSLVFSEWKEGKFETTFVTLPNVSYSEQLTLSISYDGTPAIAMIVGRGSDAKLVCAERKAGDWRLSDLGEAYNKGVSIKNPILQFDQKNTPFIAFYDNRSDELCLAHRDDKKWEVHRLAAKIYEGRLDFKINSQGTPTIAYPVASRRTRSLMLVRHKGGKWLKEVVVEQANLHTISAVFLGFGVEGEPVIGYNAAEGSGFTSYNQARLKP